MGERRIATGLLAAVSLGVLLVVMMVGAFGRTSSAEETAEPSASEAPVTLAPSITVAWDGTEPWDTADTGAGNGVVRRGDVVGYSVTVAVSGGAAVSGRMVLEFRPTAVEVVALPAACSAGSTAEATTVSCPLDAAPAEVNARVPRTATSVDSMSLTVRADADNAAQHDVVAGPVDTRVVAPFVVGPSPSPSPTRTVKPAPTREPDQSDGSAGTPTRTPSTPTSPTRRPVPSPTRTTPAPQPQPQPQPGPGQPPATPPATPPAPPFQLPGVNPPPVLPTMVPTAPEASLPVVAPPPAGAPPGAPGAPAGPGASAPLSENQGDVSELTLTPPVLVQLAALAAALIGLSTGSLLVRLHRGRLQRRMLRSART